MRVCGFSAGHAVCETRGARYRIRTALVGPLRHGDWVLVRGNDACQCLEPSRAAEIDATLDLLLAAAHDDDPSVTPAFSLPSAMDEEALARMLRPGLPEVGAC